ncbi:Vacuolar protein sorting-associated protein VTA1 -like protein [Escovopsis weberi]|uniref:Vacuolar protein sorting-associated protein VTA1-like protein n=1 Tax=Escovopsis weberi TaxID=150374 RepID=A0A0M9VUP9_ESCWE|nr:Vacuolar protein sorting-associated protein VTA1 -like protein [Escovopsis weberi]
MAEPLPPPLKIPEISRFLNRANQLRSFKPAIAYWCEYHAVNQIVGKSLHTTDDDCFNFTKTLLERLETTKAERADDDAIMDNTVGRAYVEQFAQETFDRAERTLRADKVTRQTADTFDAAATFFDLTHEWGSPEADILQKIKFAKWNAARILKAIREGRDPNESNPKPSEPEHPDNDGGGGVMDLDPLDPAVLQITGSGPGPGPAPPHAVQVEDVPDAGEPAPQDAGPMPSAPAEPAAEEEPFPQPSSVPSAPEMPADFAAPVADTQFHRQPAPQGPPGEMLDFPPAPPATQPPPPAPAAAPRQFPPISLPPTQLHPPPSLPVATPPVSAVPGHAPPQITSTGGGTLASDQKSMNQAQKHAKWAISALNFEDVPTAVKELRNALSALGAL